MSSSSSKIPRIELTRERSSTLESIQSLTRAIRESLRLHSVRREKKRQKKKAAKGEGSFLDVKDSKRIRSKSMDNATMDDAVEDDRYEISDVGISAVIVSDIGPTTDCSQDILARQMRHINPAAPNNSDEVFEDAKQEQVAGDKEDQQIIDSEQNRQRRQSKSVDEFELAHIRKQKQQAEAEARRAAAQGKPQQIQQMSLDIVDREQQLLGKQPARQASMPNAGCSIRRTSKDDSEVTKVDASVLRKRFARLLDTLRSHKFSITQLEESNNNSSSTLKPDSSNA